MVLAVDSLATPASKRIAISQLITSNHDVRVENAFMPSSVPSGNLDAADSGYDGQAAHSSRLEATARHQLSGSSSTSPDLRKRPLSVNGTRENEATEKESPSSKRPCLGPEQVAPLADDQKLPEGVYEVTIDCRLCGQSVVLKRPDPAFYKDALDEHRQTCPWRVSRVNGGDQLEQDIYKSHYDRGQVEMPFFNDDGSVNENPIQPNSFYPDSQNKTLPSILETESQYSQQQFSCYPAADNISEQSTFPQLFSEGSESPCTYHRKLQLLADNISAEVVPDRALCLLCNTWVEFQERQYDLDAWSHHIASVQHTYKLYERTTTSESEPPAPRYLEEDKINPQNTQTGSDIPQLSSRYFSPHSSKEDVVQKSQNDCVISPEHPPLPNVTLALQATSTTQDHLNRVQDTPNSRPKRKYRTAVERKTFLLSDSSITQVEPERVYCSLCKIWVDLKEKRGYNVTEWFVHCQSRKHSYLSNNRASIIQSPL